MGCTRICQKNLKSFFKLRLLKVKNLKYPFWRIDKEKSIQLIEKGGWHFILNESKRYFKKLKTWLILNLIEKTKNINSIESNIKNLKDPFNRNLNLKN